MAKVLFSTWNSEFIDNRKKKDEDWKESSFNLPETYDGK